MTIEKHHGGYRISKMVKGKRYRVYVDHEPTESEAFLLIAKKANEITPSSDITFKTACDLYIESKSNVLSVTTIYGYKAIMKSISEGFMQTYLSKISLPAVQTELNKYSVKHTPKSVKNMSGFITGVLKFFSVQINSPKLPQKEKKSPYIPSKEEVKKIFHEIKGSRIEIPVMLACMGLRRSEICALTLEDLKGHKLFITKAKVLDADHNWVIKSTKTTDSTREVIIPDNLAKLIKKQGYIYDGYPGKITEELNIVQKKLGIPKFSLHKLRHFFASYMHDLGYSDKQIEAMGGWKTDSVMRTVYTHAMDMDEAKKKAASDISALM